MRKFLSISILCLYLIASAGLTITAHYCGGNLASLALFQNESSCCGDDETNCEDDGCCKDEIKTIKISSEQLKAEQNKIVSLDIDDIIKPPHRNILNKLSPSHLLKSTRVPKPPGRVNLIPAYKRNHSFLFYS